MKIARPPYCPKCLYGTGKTLEERQHFIRTAADKVTTDLICCPWESPIPNELFPDLADMRCPTCLGPMHLGNNLWIDIPAGTVTKVFAELVSRHCFGIEGWDQPHHVEHVEQGANFTLRLFNRRYRVFSIDLSWNILTMPKQFSSVDDECLHLSTVPHLLVKAIDVLHQYGLRCTQRSHDDKQNWIYFEGVSSESHAQKLRYRAKLTWPRTI